MKKITVTVVYDLSNEEIVDVYRGSAAQIKAKFIKEAMEDDHLSREDATDNIEDDFIFTTFNI